MAFGASVGVAGEGAEFLAAPAQGVGGFGVLPRVAAVVVEGEQAGMCEVVGVVGAGGKLVLLPLQVVQPLRFAPFRNRALRCVGHGHVSPVGRFRDMETDSCWFRAELIAIHGR